MEEVYTFSASNGQGAAASSMKSGANLLGGSEAWIYQATLDAAEMDLKSGVVGIGNAHEVLEYVRATGVYVALPASD